MPGRLEFDVTFRGKNGGPSRSAGAPLRMLLLADLSGREARRARGEAVAPRRPLLVDAADLDKAVAALAPRIPLAGAATGTTLAIASLEDLHPDALLASVPALAEPLRLRRALAGGGSDGAVAEAEAWLKSANAVVGADAPSTPLGSGQPPPPASSESASDTLARLLGRPGSSPPATGGAASPLQGLLEEVVRPHVVRGADGRTKALVQALDEVLTARLRAVLRDPGFVTVEAAWRGVHRLVSALDTTEDLHLGLLDITRDELAADVGAGGGDLGRSSLHRTLEATGPWSVLAADYAVGLDLEDIALVAALGAIGARAGAPVLAGAHPSLLGASTLADLADLASWQPAAPDAVAFWQELRQSPVAPWIGLGAPRVLLRLPYGKATEPVDAFPFEELPAGAGADPACRLWGGAGFALAQLLGAAFREAGWEMQPGDVLGLDDLPAHVHDDEGERRLVPCAEVALGERAAEAALRAGVMPFVAHRDRAAVRVARLQSIAAPPAPLAGPWDG